MIHSFNSRSAILWQQVWGLAAFLAAIIFSWMAYGYYQPKILQQLDFTDLAAWLGILQGLLATVIEPLIGKLSDRFQDNLGSRLPMISVGVTLAGLIFVIVSLLVQQNLTMGLRWIVPLLMTFWVIAMIIFRGPAIALLRQLAPVKELPQANAVLLLVFGLLGAIGPLLDILLNSIGPSITFLLAAIALIFSAYIFRLFLPTHTLETFNFSHNTSAKAPTLLLILIFIVGFGASLEVNLLMSIFPQELQTNLPKIKPEIIASSILFVSAIAAVFLGELTAKIGANKGILFGLGSTTALMGVTLLNDSRLLTLALIFGFGISFGLIFISMIPFALEKVPVNQAGLSTGLYFGGGGAATALISILMKQPSITPFWAFLLAESAFFLVAGLMYLAKKIRLI